MSREIPNWLGHYRPWIGDAFETQRIWPRVRLLLLGESHYFGSPEDNISSVTRELICDATNGLGLRYFNRLPEILLGRHNLSVAEQRRTWHAVAFSEICQVAAMENHVPPPGAFECSKPAIYQLVTFLHPSHILFVSKRAWDNTSYDDRFKKAPPDKETRHVGSRRQPYEFCHATIDDDAFWMTYILHPTASRPPPRIEDSAAVVRYLLSLE